MAWRGAHRMSPRDWIKVAILWLGVIQLSHGQIAENSPQSIRLDFMLHIVNYSLLTNDQTRQPLGFCFYEGADSAYFDFMRRPEFKNDAKVPLKVLKVESLNQETVSNCSYLFISKEKESAEIYNQVKLLNGNTVTIGETTKFVKSGGQISLVEITNKIKIVIHRTQYQNSPVKFSARLLRYANFTG